jgi:hypothetical protein
VSAEIWWRLTKPVSRPVPASGPRADPDRNPARVLSTIALASVAAGAINIAAAATVGRGSTQNLAFFSVIAAGQLVWGVVSIAEAPRWWLAVGAAGNLVVVATGVVSRTVGLPLGDYAGITLPVGFPDALATPLEAVIVAGAAVLMIRGHGPMRGPGPVPARRRRGSGGSRRADRLPHPPQPVEPGLTEPHTGRPPPQHHRPTRPKAWRVPAGLVSSSRRRARIRCPPAPRRRRCPGR